MNNEKLTLEWLIKMLSTDGINSKKIVRERLKNLTSEDVKNLIKDLEERN